MLLGRRYIIFRVEDTHTRPACIVRWTYWKSSTITAQITPGWNPEFYFQNDSGFGKTKPTKTRKSTMHHGTARWQQRRQQQQHHQQHQMELHHLYYTPYLYSSFYSTFGSSASSLKIREVSLARYRMYRVPCSIIVTAPCLYQYWYTMVDQPTKQHQRMWGYNARMYVQYWYHSNKNNPKSSAEGFSFSSSSKCRLLLLVVLD